MDALIRAVVARRKISVRDFFRYAYIFKFHKDIPWGALDDDVKAFESSLNAPPYVVDYVVAYYATNSVERMADATVAHEAARLGSVLAAQASAA